MKVYFEKQGTGRRPRRQNVGTSKEPPIRAALFILDNPECLE